MKKVLITLTDYQASIVMDALNDYAEGVFQAARDTQDQEVEAIGNEANAIWQYIKSELEGLSGE